ncbi:MAG: shikimate kinase [Planctomycetes bacterium]|nr:shikimate kinase [Planctomycetota bacterium]
MGPRGCGKTHVGRAVAARVGWKFRDTDDLIEQAAGCSVREIFARAGEEAFRRRETQAIERVTRARQQVISVGGGAVLAERNRFLLSKAGWCVWLTAPAEELHRRLQADPRTPALRPALTAAGGLAEIRRLLRMRNPLYAALADQTVDTAGQSVEQVVEAVVALLAAWASAEPERPETDPNSRPV